MRQKGSTNKSPSERGIRRRSPNSWEVTVSAGVRDAAGKYIRNVATVRGTLEDAVKARGKMLLEVRTKNLISRRVRRLDKDDALDWPEALQKHEYSDEAALKRVYGLTQADLHLLLVQQRGRCAICRRAGKLMIDHDHETGLVRGLLCRRCNIALGMMSDDIGLLYGAIRYVSGKREGVYDTFTATQLRPAVESSLEKIESNSK